ncbi:unnamed protein product, partial [Symbiodinium pilosum]
VNTHTFRDRQKAKEKLISAREFGVHYETEKDRIKRAEAEQQFLRLPREAWAPGQCAPPHLTPRDARSNTALRTRDTKPKLADTIGELIVSDIRMPYASGYPECRAKQPKPGPGQPRQSFTTMKQGRFLQATSMGPGLLAEPWTDRARAEWWDKIR